MTDDTNHESWAALAAALDDRFDLERVAARGGMATVFLAREPRSGRMVAVKLMHPRLVDAVGVERFQREMAIARGMSHPLIVPLEESGRAGELLYYVMPFVEGESLHERLARTGHLPLDEAIAVVLDVASALGAAHARGILHRDVKPENILLAGGRAMVADFGLARAIGAADYEKLTQTGVVVGTVPYMSPEQVRDDPDLDQRTDIYGLGCVLYEMLMGAPPFRGPSLREQVRQILRNPPPPLHPGVPEPVAQAVHKALAKSAAERYRTMEEFAAALPAPTRGRLS